MAVSLSQGIFEVFEELCESPDEARKQMRAVEVERCFKNAVEEVFKKGALLVLKHTNAVYCFEENGVQKFIVYSDDSSIRASLDARQELLKVSLFKQGLSFTQFKTLPAQKSIKTRHPFENTVISPEKPVFRQLTAEEVAEIEEFVAPIEDESVREALKQAVMSDLKTRKK